MSFRNTSLSRALLQASKELNIRVAFDAEKLGSVTVNGEFAADSPGEFIEKLLKGTGFTFRFMYDRYLIVSSNPSADPPQTGTCSIVGSVTDNESGESLPYATVAVYNNNYLTSASGSGSFCLKEISANPVHLLISYIGYLPVDTFMYWSDPRLNLDIKLKRRVMMLDTIYVKGSSLGMVDLRNDVDFATTVDPSRMIDLPVLAETDIFRMLQLLPGISYSENSSGMSIRGGSSDQNLVLYDGQTLYNLSHFYGVVSSINPNVVKDLQIYKGGYDSRFGERVSGIIDITGKAGNQVRPSVYGDINLLDANLAAEIPFSRKLTLIAAARRSYSDIYATEFSDGLFTRNTSSLLRDSSAIVNIAKPSFNFYDYNAKLTYRLSNLESVSVSLYGGEDNFMNSYGQDARRFDIESEDLNKWRNYGLSGAWMKQWNGSLYTSFQAGSSGYTNDYSNSTSISHPAESYGNHRFLPDTVNLFETNSRNRLKDYFVSARSNYRISENNELDFGALVRHNDIYYHRDADRIYIYDNTEQSALTSTVYLQDRISAGNKLFIKPGLRLTYYTGNSGLYAEPRLSVNYRPLSSLSFRIAAGRYYQFISQVLAQQETGYNKNFWILADNTGHPAVSSDHFVAGLTAEHGRLLFDAEAYIKTFSGLQEYIYVSQYLRNSDFSNYFPHGGSQEEEREEPSYFVTGRGQSYGTDLMLRYRSRVYTGWISFSWGRSLQTYKGINNGAVIPSPNDEPIRVSLTSLVSVGKWNFGAVTLFSSGKPYISSMEGSSSGPLYRDYKRLPDYFRSDLSLNYNFNLLKIKFKAGTTVYNVFNTQNYFDINNRKFDFLNSSFTEATLIRSQALSVNFFLHFIF